jgi:hypothetical protein
MNNLSQKKQYRQNSNGDSNRVSFSKEFGSDLSENEQKQGGYKSRDHRGRINTDLGHNMDKNSNRRSRSSDIDQSSNNGDRNKDLIRVPFPENKTSAVTRTLFNNAADLGRSKIDQSNLRRGKQTRKTKEDKQQK